MADRVVSNGPSLRCQQAVNGCSEAPSSLQRRQHPFSKNVDELTLVLSDIEAVHFVYTGLNVFLDPFDVRPTRRGRGPRRRAPEARGASGRGGTC